MAGMRRRAFNFVAALSLVLCVAMCALWVRSYNVATVLALQKVASIDGSHFVRCRSYSLEADRRGISYRVHSGKEIDFLPHGWSAGFASRDPAIFESDVRFFGFGYSDSKSQFIQSLDHWHEWSWREWTVPHWSLVLLLGFAPALAIKRVLRNRQRRQPGHCPSCGYDLRATPDRCPECGREDDKVTR
jgi:hypothetical protein